MDTTTPNMQTLFAQLGLPDSEQEIDDFVRLHHPLPMTTRLYDAPFWSKSQAALIREKLTSDGDWALVIDNLNTRLREHPSQAEMSSAD